LKHLFTYKDLFESTSAGSQDRGSVDLPPFKFAINYDPRLGYTKQDFCSDLAEIYRGMTKKERSELMDVVFKNAGVFRISKMADLSQETVDRVIQAVELHLDSKSDYKMQVLPDGYILCYEGLKNKKRLCDVYYSPSESNVKISYTDSYPEMEDLVISIDDFNPSSINVEPDDFSITIKKCNDFLGKAEVTASKDNPDNYSL
jgi:hypothetical protein